MDAETTKRWQRAGIGLAVWLIALLALIWLAPAEYYSWFKAFHVIGVMAWLAGMLYLPRLFVYHCDAERGSKQSETFKVMERRLLRGIINPAMVVTWVLGPWLAWTSGFYDEPWFQTKFACVVLLTVLHGFFSRWVNDFSADRNQRSAKFYRIINEVPAVLMVLIVILVVIKPF